MRDKTGEIVIPEHLPLMNCIGLRSPSPASRPGSHGTSNTLSLVHRKSQPPPGLPAYVDNFDPAPHKRRDWVRKGRQ